MKSAGSRACGPATGTAKQELAGRCGEGGGAPGECRQTKGQRDLTGSRRDCGAFQPLMPLSTYHTYSGLGTVLGGKTQKTASNLTGRQLINPTVGDGN